MLTSVILAGKRDSRRHSATGLSESVLVAGKSYQTLKVLWGEGLTSSIQITMQILEAKKVQ